MDIVRYEVNGYLIEPFDIEEYELKLDKLSGR